MKLFNVIVTGIKTSDGSPYMLETSCQANSISEVESCIFDYDWSDAETMVINIWPSDEV